MTYLIREAGDLVPGDWNKPHDYSDRGVLCDYCGAIRRCGITPFSDVGVAMRYIETAWSEPTKHICINCEKAGALKHPGYTQVSLAL